VLVAEGVQDSQIPAGGQTDNLAAIQRQAAQVLGISIEDLAAMHAARASSRTGIHRLQALKGFAAGLRAEGAIWSRLPKVPFPRGVAGASVALSLR
jgi:hypothetical protein